MRHRHPRPTFISMAVAGACALAGSAQAQQESSAAAQQAGAPSGEASVQQVVVTGFRSSLEKALDLKRAAIGARDSIVAEDIGKFPEQNIADALQRLPGIEVVKDFVSNEGQRIQLRGLGPEYTVTTFNGAPVRATSSYNIGSATRDFNYDVFPSEMFGRVDVYKTPMAELEEGGVAGAVDMHSPKPFDRKGRQIRYSAAGAHNSRSGKISPRAAVLFSNTWDKWGVLVSVSRNRNVSASGGFQSTGTYASFNQRFTSGNTGIGYNLTDPRTDLGKLSLAELYDANLPRFYRINSQQNQRDRLGINASLQYKSGPLDISWDGITSNMKDQSRDRNLDFPTTNNRAIVPMGVWIDGNNQLQGRLGNMLMGSGGAMSDAETRFKYNALNLKYRISDRLRIAAQAAVNSSFAWRNNAGGGSTTSGTVRHVLTVDTTNDPLFPSLSTDQDLLDPAIYTAFSASGSYRSEGDKQKSLRMSAEYDYGFWNVEAKLKAGVSRVESTKEARSYTTPNPLNTYTIPGVGPYASATPEQQIAFGRSLLVQNDLARNAGGGGVYPTNWLVFGADALQGTLQIFERNRSSPLNLGGSFDAVETITAAFVQSDFEHQVWGRTLRSNVGVRYVQTETDIDNYGLVDGKYQPANNKGQYRNVLPSASTALDLTKDLVWRASIGKTITRSSISAIARPYAVLGGGGDLILNEGNPNLKPQHSLNIDTSLEWYFQKGGVVAASAFQKDIKGRLKSSSRFVPFDTLGLPKELFTGNIVAQLTANPSLPAEVRQFVNAEQFKVRGLELAYQQQFRALPAPFNNLGTIVSATRIETEGVTRVYNGKSYDLPIIPERTYALTLWYEDGPLALRTSWNRKSEYANFGQAGTNPLGYQRWYNARSYLDASIGYKISNHLELRLDGSNLGKTRTYEFMRHFEGRNGDPHSRLEGASEYGRTITLSMRGRF